MKALVVNGAHQIEIEDIPYPKPGFNEVTIKVENCGICGTDLHIYSGEFPAQYPIVPGHEFSGTIHEIGEGVADFRVGDRVVIDGKYYCGKCTYCRTRKGNHCEIGGGLGTTLHGGMAEYTCFNANGLIKLPDTMSFEEAAFIEPVACVMYGIKRLQMDSGSRVILFGAGGIGQQLIQVLAKTGASELVVVDVDQEKLKLALDYGATKGVLEKDLDKKINPITYPYGFDVVVDVTGIPSVIEKAFEFMGITAKFLQFGVAPPNSKISIDPFKLFDKDWTIIGTNSYNFDFLTAYNWIKEKKIEVLPIISKTISLKEAVDFFKNPKDPRLLKVQVDLTLDP